MYTGDKTEDEFENEMLQDIFAEYSSQGHTRSWFEASFACVFFAALSFVFF
jgi:hypothetical protein